MKGPFSMAAFILAVAAAWHAGPAVGNEPETGLIGWWRFDEGAGAYAASAVDAADEAELHQVSWVEGEFGTALRYTGADSYVTLPPMPEIDGADEMTLAAWVYWQGTGQYPNILTGGTWSPGGFLIFVNNQTCSFRMGRPGHRHGVEGEAWSETSAPLLNGLPMRQWVHLAAVFRRPDITTYVNGQKVGSATWDYPVGQTGELQVGRWSGSTSHRGMIDDVRIYRRALDSQQVLELANPAGRQSPNYRDLGPAQDEGRELVRIETRWASLAISDSGKLSSLREKVSGRELLAESYPVLAVELATGRRLRVRRMRHEDGLLIAEFPRGAGTATIRIDARDHYFVATAVSLDVPDVRRFTFFQLSPSPDKYLGNMAGLASDDQSGVCLRSLTLEVDTSFRNPAPQFRAATTAEHGLVGSRIGLAAGPRDQLIPMLRAMAEHEPVPKSPYGGPWAIGAEATRGSYLFANLAARDTDAWIDLARRGGFTNIHFHGWWRTLGHYEPRIDYFPNGLDDMKQTAARIREAGLKPGIHTLTACISTNDPWVTPVPSPNLIASNRYTLARQLSPTDTTIHIKEQPATNHDVVWSYSGNGNALRVGTELIRYSDVSRQPPFGFLGCERGAFQTQASGHAEGTSVDYLQQRYLAFYPEPGSALADELADRIARIYNECGMEMIYFDGSEGMRSRFGIDAMRWAIFRRLQGGVTEASQWGHNSWWFHSRLGAWDHPVWAAKRFHDEHIRLATLFRKSDLLEPQLGWWAPRGPASVARGHFPDEMEYFAAKNLAIDGPMSVQGVSVADRPWNARMEEQFTILGWYERMRLARYFDAASLQRVGEPGQEFRLRLHDSGRWQFTPAQLAGHRVTALGNGSERWEVQNPFAAQPVRLRLEALYSVAPYDDPQAVVLADFADPDRLNNRKAAAEVTTQVELVSDDVQAGEHSLRFRATNRGASARGAWALIGTSYQHPYFSMAPGEAMGLWVKGDGSQALLNVQLRSPREYHGCISDHYIDLDFTGWRYVELLLRERDSDRLSDYVWPYSGAGGSHAIYRNAVDREHLSQVNLLLNEIPAGGEVNILVSPIQSLPVRRAELVNPSVTVGETTLTFPVTLQSGQYLELESLDHCVLYDERGELVHRFQPRIDRVPTLTEGLNSIHFDCTAPQELSARAEVTVISLGQPFGNPQKPAKIDWARLDREYEIPRIITRIDGRDNVWKINRRKDGPSGKAGSAPLLELEIACVKSAPTKKTSDDPANNDDLAEPTLTIGSRSVRFPTRLIAGQRLFCRDGVTWYVLNADGTNAASGELPTPIPQLAPGTNTVKLEFWRQLPAGLRAVVKIVKVYR